MTEPESSFNRKTAVALAVVLGAIALIGLLSLGQSERTESKSAPAAEETGPTGAIWQVSWAYSGESIAEMAADAEVVVRAWVKSIRPGKPLITTSAKDVDPLPTQIVTMATLRVLKGAIASEFELFKQGTQNKWIQDDRPYEIGETCLLFLQKRPDGLYIPLGPDGRMDVRETRELGVQLEGAIARELRQPGSDSLAEVETIAQNPTS